MCHYTKLNFTSQGGLPCSAGLKKKVPENAETNSLRNCAKKKSTTGLNVTYHITFKFLIL